MMNEWVQYHNDPTGKKWRVVVEYLKEWRVEGDDGWQYLPKSEYRICLPPDKWEAVTASVDYCGNLAFAHRGGGRFGDDIVMDDKGYRFTKIDGLHNGPAFIVERRRQ